jgi:hypothetical protein
MNCFAAILLATTLAAAKLDRADTEWSLDNRSRFYKTSFSTGYVFGNLFILA